MSNTELAVKNNGMISNFAEMERAAGAMAASGFFKDVSQGAQALVKIMAGSEMGFGAFASMAGIHIIQGKPAIGANLIAAAVKRSGKYDYRVTRLDETGCEIIFYQGNQEIGKSSFTEADAKKAGLLSNPTWSKFARNMYFSRAMSNGAKWFCPDVFSAPIYTPEELGATVDGDGEVIESSFAESKPEVVVPPVVSSEPVALTDEMIAVETNSEGVLYTDLDTSKLSFMGNALKKSIAKNHLEAPDKAEKVRKLAVIDAILLKRTANQ